MTKKELFTDEILNGLRPGDWDKNKEHVMSVVERIFNNDNVLPTRLPDDKFDLTDLIDTCQGYIDFVDDDEQYHEDHDYRDYIFETAMQAIFGKKVFDWINNRRD